MRGTARTLGLRRAAGLALSLALAGSLAACAASRSEAPQALARVRVELWRGLGEGAAPPGPVPTWVVADLAPSYAMDPPFVATQAAQRAAARYLAAQDPGSPLELVALGIAGAGESCAPAVPIQSAGATAGPALAELLLALEPRGRGSLGEALDSVVAALEARPPDAPPGARVVMFSALQGGCPPDPCAAAERLVALGADLDLVVLGNAPVPACLSALPVPLERPPGLDVAPLSAEGFFRVEHRVLRSSGGATREPTTVTVAEGPLGGPAVEVVPGAARVVVQLPDREIPVPPLVLGAGVETRIRVLDAGPDEPPQIDVGVVAPDVRTPPPGSGWE